MLLRFIILIILCFRYSAYGQESSNLVMSNINDLTTLKSFPSTCLRNYYDNSLGKRYYTVCQFESFYYSGIYGYDGYSFKKIETPHPFLNELYKTYVGMRNDRLYGHAESKEWFYLFYYNTLDNTYTIYDKIDKTTISKTTTQNVKEVYQYFQSDTLFTVFKEDQHCYLSVYNADNALHFKPIAFGQEFKVKEEHQIFSKYYSLTINMDKFGLDIIDLRNGHKEFIPLREIKNIDKNYMYILRQHKDVLFLKYRQKTGSNAENTYRLDAFQIENSNGIQIQFQKSIFSTNFHTLGYITNSKGQGLETFTQNNEHQCIIYDQNNDRYQLKDFDGVLKTNTLKNVKLNSHDFLNEIVLTDNNGSYLLSLSKEYITTYAKGYAIRGLGQIDEKKFWFLDEGRLKGRIMSSTSPFANNDSLTISVCNFDGYKVVNKDTSIWGLVDNQIAVYHTNSSECEILETETAVDWFTLDNNDRIIYKDTKNRVWLFDPDSKTSKRLIFDVELQINNDYLDLFVDSQNTLWIISPSGIYTYNLVTDEHSDLSSLLKSYNIISINEGLNGDILLGTLGNGLLVFNKNDNTLIKTVDETNGLSDNSIASITKGKQNYFWLGTYDGVSVLDGTYKTIKTLYEEDGLVNNECNRYSSLLLDDGRLLLGGIDGISLIHTNDILEDINNTKKLTIILSSFMYYDGKSNRDIALLNSGDEDYDINLPPTAKNISISLSTNTYTNLDDTLFYFKIDKDENWTSIAEDHTLNFFELPAGQHKLLLKATHQGVSSTNLIKLNIKMGSYFYQKAWFYLLIFFGIISLLIAIIYTFKHRLNLATSELKQQNIKLSKLDAYKNEFFTNITHEFRTPLTVIKGITQLLKEKQHGEITENLNKIDNQSTELLSMINQILDLQKLEARELKLNLTTSNIVGFTDYLVDSCQQLALQKGVHLALEASEAEIIAPFDQEKYKSILLNLITNAVKFTPKGGKVNVVLAENEDKLLIKVSDTGIGIKKEDFDRVFERYHQSKHSEDYEEKGFGIGLHFTRELVWLMKGSITLESELHKGTTFVVQLPLIKEESPTAEQNPIPNTSPNKETTNTAEIDFPLPETDAVKILVVEDNSAIQELLQNQLSEFSIYTACDGREGLKLANEIGPDIIISDVMMPNMNGFELCEAVKNAKETSHIPIILLTAKTDQQSKIEGLSVRADVYINKPYDITELRLNIRNLLDNRKYLQDIYKNLNENAASSTQPKEDLFIRELRGLIKANLGTEKFGITSICDIMQISRMHLHNKLKALTGLSTSAYIKHIRLLEAKSLIENSNLNFSDITFRVGMPNQAYFSRHFKKEFGMSPKQYRESLV